MIRPSDIGIFLLSLSLTAGCTLAQPEIQRRTGQDSSSPLQTGEEENRSNEEAPLKLERIGAIQRVTLHNGLTVLVLPRNNSPVAAIQVWVNVGSADEQPGEEGMAHLHEHMLFKGTKTRAVGESTKRIESAGGEMNAWTSFDHTVYHAVVASRHLDIGLEELADAVQNPTFDPVELEREKKVVLEEIKRSHDLPGRWINDLLFGSIYKKHPYRSPILGSAASLEKIGRKEILDFFKRHYTPDRMMVVVVGDVDPNHVFKRIRSLFPHKASVGKALPNRIQEPDQRKLRIDIKTEDIQEAHFNLGWHIPSVHGAQMPALDITATLLGQGESSRLNLGLKRGLGLVNDIYAYAYTPKDPGAFVIGGSCPTDKLLSSIKQISYEIARMDHLPVGATELTKVKTMIESDALYAQETAEGTARRMAYFQTLLGDPTYGDVYLTRVMSVSPADIKQVTLNYLRPTNLSLVVLLPKDGTLSEEQVRQAIDEGIAAAPSGEAEPAATQAGITRVNIKNGPLLLVEEDHTNALVSLRAAFLGGTRYENPSNNGINNFIAGLITKGTTRSSAAEIAADIDSIAGSISGFSGRNSFGMRAEFPSRHFDKGLTLFADCLLHPSFPEKEVKRERELVLEEINSRDDNLSGLAFDLFASTLYPSHPYRMTILGTRASVAGFRRQQLLEYWATQLAPDKMVLSVVGDVDTARVVEQVRALFSSPAESKKTAKAPVLPLDPPPKEIRIAQKNRPRNQAHLVLGFMGTTLSSEDRFPLEVLTAVLTGQGGRLFQELRDRKSLAYSVTGFSLEGIEPGYIAIYLAVDPKRLDEAVAEVKTQLAQLVREPISHEELKRAQNYLVGTHAISLQRGSARGTIMAFDEVYGLGYSSYKKYPEEIMAVTVEDVTRVTQKYFKLDAYVLAVVSPDTNALGKAATPNKPQR